MAKWAGIVFAVLAVIALVTIVLRLVRTPRQHVLGPGIALVVAAALCAGSFAFLSTRVVHIRLDSIKEIGLELRHDGLRTNALRYDTTVSITATLKAPGFLHHIVADLVHKTTTVDTQVAVYGLIDFTTVDAKVATVDRQARTITFSLPDPQVGPNTTYIASVNGVQEHEGPVTAVANDVTGFIGSLFGLPVVSVNPEPELMLAETRALAHARRSVALASCGKEEIVSQLTGIFQLVPAYRGYSVVVHWPVPPDPKINCAALQHEFIQSGS
ncbi:MAG TPA: hypothetical protein VMR14_06335 [Streptosporangiaceae bacterium]|nr:hypothetical protein [Streptosporangiaceae bacterium]